MIETNGATQAHASPQKAPGAGAGAGSVRGGAEAAAGPPKDVAYVRSIRDGRVTVPLRGHGGDLSMVAISDDLSRAAAVDGTTGRAPKFHRTVNIPPPTESCKFAVATFSHSTVATVA